MGSIRLLKDIFEEFSYSTGLKENISKRRIYFEGVNLDEQEFDGFCNWSAAG